MSRIVSLILLATLAVPAWPAEERKDADTLARAVAPYVHARTFGVVHVDLARLDLPALVRWMQEQKLEGPKGQSPIREMSSIVEPLRRAGVQDVCVVLDLDQDIDELPPIVVTLEPKAGIKGVATVLRGLLMMTKNAQLEEGDGFLVVAGTKTFERLRKVKPVKRPEVAKVLAGRKEGAHHLLVFPPNDVRRAFDEMVPEMPSALGGGSVRPLSHGLRWLAVSADLPPKPRLSLAAQAADRRSAAALKHIMERGIPLLVEHHRMGEALPALGKILGRFQLKAEGDLLTWSLGGEEGTTLLVESIRQLRDVHEQTEAASQFHQILIALHNYNDSHKGFPPAVFTDKAGKPLLSWRVHILPYIEQDNLYRQFHLDEPWDSEHNKKLIARMPKTFASPSHPELARQGKTTYLAPVGKNTVFPGTTGIRIQDITDGTSNTIMLVDTEADRAVIWTKPDDLPIDLDNPSKGLGLSVRKKFMVGMADGSVRFLDRGISKTTLRHAFERNDGQVLGPDW